MAESVTSTPRPALGSACKYPGTRLELYNLMVTFAIVFGARATTAQFHQGHVTKNQPIAMLVLFSESLAIALK